MLVFSCLLIWDKEEQEKSVASEEVNTGHFPLKTIRECLRFGYLGFFSSITWEFLHITSIGAHLSNCSFMQVRNGLNCYFN